MVLPTTSQSLLTLVGQVRATWLPALASLLAANQGFAAQPQMAAGAAGVIKQA